MSTNIEKIRIGLVDTGNNSKTGEKVKREHGVMVAEVKVRRSRAKRQS